ncbi:MAG: FAD-binding oxidoreductase [Alphaproteobacteria bacterium]|nr:FAD-binding oxidoreductase [Alphaproteobacteria bacterium]
MRVAVLGAGLQGACTAFALAQHAITVDLFERNDDAMCGASGHNEGKLHLGFVYAADRSLATARLMMRAAACFAPNLRRWLGAALDAVAASSPFHYVVHRDSLLAPGQVAAHLDACRDLALTYPNPGGGGYFGADFHAPARALADAERAALFDDRTVAAAFLTPEIAIDPGVLAALVRHQLRTIPQIRPRYATRVLSVRPGGRSVTVEFAHAGARGEEAYDHVVNAAWDGRLAIDETAGIVPERPWLWRVKHFLRVRATAGAAPVPSATIVLGPFGDVVAYANGDVYLSWYPESCTVRSAGIAPPPVDRSPALAARLRDSMPRALAAVVPSLARLPAGGLSGADIDGGVIFAWGERDSDVDDPASVLHTRARIGVHSHGRYHSIDTGKYTTAPLFAVEAAERIRLLR